ncbi:hypothetical protein ERUR111494_02580 [Erysipelothrix urinaevulpis]|uniref:hypothetical protein n=1 Tax=Erysipelothrix urinaevulpis TaxID=2683717 RepID=UPI0013571AB2|nr:hypothetical protein [Erysipelothrix urinaevulpis]
MGLNLDYYWSLNPKQFQKHYDAYNSQVRERVEYDDFINHMLGRYVMIAVHDPENYPEEPFTSLKTKVEEKMTDERMEKIARRNTLLMGGEIV